MTAEVESVQAVAPATPAKTPVKEKKVTKAKAAAVKGARKPIAHPPTADMVNAAIAALKECGGSSVIAIKKYVISTYKVDGEKIAPFIKMYLKSAVTSGKIVQTKGTGASGSFKLPASSKPKPATTTTKPKKAAVKKVKKTASSSVTDKKPKVKKASSTGAKKKLSTSKSKVVKTKLAAAKKTKTPVKKDKKAAAPKKSLLKKVKKVAKTPKPKKVVVKK